MNIRDRGLENEFVFQTSRSSGPGGQNVNKVSSKVELRFNIEASAILNEEEKKMILIKLEKRINKSGELLLICQSDRSQLKNREGVVEKFYLLISNALKPRLKRVRTKPTQGSVEKRLESKRILSAIKANRKDIEP